MRGALLVWLIVAGWPYVAGVAKASQDDLRQMNLLLDAIAKVESRSSPCAIGDGGKAYGAYLLHYGQGCSLLEMARIHNGGPNGHRKQSTLEYARRIARVLNDAGPAQR